MPHVRFTEAQATRRDLHLLPSNFHDAEARALLASRGEAATNEGLAMARALLFGPGGGAVPEERMGVPRADEATTGGPRIDSRALVLAAAAGGPAALARAQETHHRVDSSLPAIVEVLYRRRCPKRTGHEYLVVTNRGERAWWARAHLKVFTDSELAEVPWLEDVYGGDATCCAACDMPEPDDPDHGAMLLCELCNAGYHLGCLRPPLPGVPDGDWYCPACERERRAAFRAVQQREAVEEEAARKAAVAAAKKAARAAMAAEAAAEAAWRARAA